MWICYSLIVLDFCVFMTSQRPIDVFIATKICNISSLFWMNTTQFCGYVHTNFQIWWYTCFSLTYSEKMRMHKNITKNILSICIISLNVFIFTFLNISGLKCYRINGVLRQELDFEPGLNNLCRPSTQSPVWHTCNCFQRII